MLEHTAPIVETGGFEGRLIGMLRDSGENINWREISSAPRDPNYVLEAIYAPDIPPPPPGNYKLILKVLHTQWFVLTQLTFNYADDDSGWAFHNWVLNTQGWNAYRNKYGVPV